MAQKLDLEKIAKAYAGLQHFSATHPSTDESPKEFHEVIVESIESGLFTRNELVAGGVTTTVIDNAFNGAATGIDPKQREAIVKLGIIRAERALGIRAPANA